MYMSPVTDPASLEPGFTRDPWRAHVSAVEVLRQCGIEPPAPWSALLGRYTHFIELPDAAADRLAAEIVSPNGANVSLLRALALVEEIARGGDDSGVNSKVQAAVLRELETLYQPVAQHNYKLSAQRFDAAAKAFTALAGACDAEASGDTLVHASPAARQAWLDAPAAAAALEEALRPLLAAAALAGAPGDVAFISGGTDTATVEHQIAIACDPGKAHRRRVWEAWARKPVDAAGGGRACTRSAFASAHPKPLARADD
jgi:hypothetical protein